MMEVAEILERAADLIEPEGRWTQGALAKSKTGRQVIPEGRSAVCWCVYGAIQRITGTPLGSRALWDALKASVGTVNIASWNDTRGRTQAEAVAALREAAALAEQGGAK
jgi:hypothetical protein